MRLTLSLDARARSAIAAALTGACGAFLTGVLLLGAAGAARAAGEGEGMASLVVNNRALAMIRTAAGPLGGMALRASLSAEALANPPAQPLYLKADGNGLSCLTAAVYYEARGEGTEGEEAVAQVVINRLRHPAFPKTLCGVVYQRDGAGHCQFTFVCDGSTDAARETAAWAGARQVAARAMGGFVMTSVGQATHYHTVAVTPGWENGMLKVAQVGMHIFYRADKGPLTGQAQRSGAAEVAPEAEVAAAPDAAIETTDAPSAATETVKPAVAAAPTVISQAASRVKPS